MLRDLSLKKYLNPLNVLISNNSRNWFFDVEEFLEKLIY